MTLKHKVKTFPQRPGVYIFKDARGRVLYVGKAKNLRSRAGSYFRETLDPDSKTYALVQSAKDIEFIEVSSEIEALVLEAHLIQKYNPHYNIVLKDDKSFLYIEILNEKVPINGRNVNIPRLKASRKGDLKKDSMVFGPFPSSYATRFVLRTLRRYFPHRDCGENKFNRYSKIGRPCLYGKINLCPAPCIGAISQIGYNKRISHIIQFLEGKSSELVSYLELKMQEASEARDFEQAAEYRDMLKNFRYVRDRQVPAHLYVQNPNLIEDLASKALSRLENEIPILNVPPKRIECFDISDLSGKNSVGAMVVARDGKVERSFYRRFKIKSVKGVDDFAKMAEVLRRRLLRLQKGDKGWEKPDLIVLDGGRGQLSAVFAVMDELQIDNIPVVGLAKKEETVVYYKDGKYEDLRISVDDAGLNLLIRLRDEAHRFAQDYHHRLRIKNLLG